MAAVLTICGGAAAWAVPFTIGTNFTGTDKAQEALIAFNETGTGSFSFPPDTMGAVGPNHIVELLNGHYATYNKSGTNLSRTRMHNFWNTAFSNAGVATSTTDSFDPRILYDPHTSRWYAAAVDNPDSTSSRVLVGVTTGNDPSLANWRGFVIDADTANTRWADFPMIGLDASGLYISSNMFDAPGGVAESTTVTFMGVPKSSLTAGVPSITGFQVRENINPSGTGFTFQPAVDLDNSALPLPGLSRFDSSNLKRTDVPADFFSGGAVGSAGTGLIASASSGTVSDAGQPGIKQNIDTGDSRFSGNVVLQNGSLWAVHSFEDSGGRTGLRWFEINAATNTTIQTGTITDPSLSLYFPSIAVNDNGDVVIGFSASDDNTYVGAYAVVGETTAGTTTFSPITLLKAGEADYVHLKEGDVRNRWGDYSATVLDPSDPNVFWTFQEYAREDRAPPGYVDPIDNNWAIQITQIIVPEPSGAMLAAIAASFCLVGFGVRRCRRWRSTVG